MSDTRFRPGRFLPTLLPMAALALVASCVAGGQAGGVTTTGTVPLVDGGEVQPRTASYACADGGLVTIENLGTSVKVLGPDGESTELPASPANQRNRYGLAADAIVIEGKEALVMKGGHEPLTCTR